MPEPKPVMLTDAEEDWITRKISTDEPTLNVAPLLHAVEDIVAAREAAARREALQKAAEVGLANGYLTIAGADFLESLADEEGGR